MAYGNQWMNPAMYKNMTNEQVDWASLAQQWIKIKETLPGMSPREPVRTQSAEHNLLRPSQYIGPKNPSNAAATTNIMLNDHNIASPVSRNYIEKPSACNTLTWHQQQHWNWSSPSTAPPTNVPIIEPTNLLRPLFNEPPPNLPMMTPNKPLPPINNWSGPNTRVPPPIEPDQWNNKPNIISNVDNKTQDTSFIDAAKQKQLPAWIREGLEKMEREKQRKIEQEQSFGKPQYSSLTNENFTQEVPNSIINFHGKTEIVDGDYIEQSSNYIDNTEMRRTGLMNDDTSPLIPRNTKAQIWEDTMLSLRKILTKLLMDVTNDMMLNVVREVLKTTFKKDIQRNQNQTSLAGNLGLGVYGSESESSNDSDEEQYAHDNNYLKQDSNEAIQKRILKRHLEFSNIEAKILIELDQLEDREKLVRSKFDNSIKLSRQINNSHILEKGRTKDEGSSQKIDKGHDKIQKELPNDLNIKNAQKKNKLISKMSSSSSSSSSSSDSKKSDDTDYKYSYRKSHNTKSKTSNKNTKTESLLKKRRSCSRNRSRSHSRSKGSRSHSRYRSRSRSRYYDRRSPQSIRSRRSRSPVSSRHSYSRKNKRKRNSSSSSNESRSNKNRYRR